jgi:hypothetical protein
MATVNKDFRVKNGLIVEGTTAQVDGKDVILDGDSVDLLVEGTTNLFFTEDRVTDTLVDTTYVQWVNAQVVKEDGVLTITAENGVEDATTDELDEGTTNLYFTNQRVQDVLVGSVQENISITSTDGILYITAENGVDDSTTDDLEEGTDNLYFTNTRVYDKTKTALVEGNGILLTADDEAETITVDVDTDEIATISYVDAVAQGLKIRGNVEAATTEDLGGTYNNGTNGVDATITIPATATLTIDGWDEWEELDGILVKDQINPEENGRYFVFVVGDAETAWVLKRCIFCDTSEEIPGSYVFVQHGTQYGATGWVATVDNLGTFTVGEDDINWVQFSGAGTFVGGNGIQIDGQDISIDFTEFDTDDIDEGTINLYYTTQKVYNDLAASVQENISITTTDGLLYITAENGVDDSTTDDLDEGTINLYFTDQRVEDVIGNLTTDDLDEGTTNLYFTDQRAVDAIEAVVPAFSAVEINSSLQVASSLGLTDAEVPYTVYSFDKTEYRSAKFLVKSASGSHTQISEILLTLDTSDNVAITEYAIVSTNGNLIEITAEENAGDVNLIVEAVNSNTTVTVFGTLIV